MKETKPAPAFLRGPASFIVRMRALNGCALPYFVSFAKLSK